MSSGELGEISSNCSGLIKRELSLQHVHIKSGKLRLRLKFYQPSNATLLMENWDLCSRLKTPACFKTGIFDWEPFKCIQGPLQ